ncbi:hypothetical protein FVEG_17159 [Fusarium verticillioides 7600]|uniref:Uncharacterized protein n=1 Tax=Gibberella moniliformis (strain M3125 / FGSC 7600) TaxID=334819 RepID=W7MRK7_GIBM7|nr:hypothetical protein FVEG_17159 [Fusarium verticillioides 7600]EWG53711.1 hypothetical protein FVEG_17159 [Fusarium verticillioides 7600]
MAGSIVEALIQLTDANRVCLNICCSPDGFAFLERNFSIGCIIIQHNKSLPTKPAIDFKENESGGAQEKVQAPVVAGSRRTVNFSYNPNDTEKLLETAEMFANVKKAFLIGKA